jgi:peroxiredoxin
MPGPYFSSNPLPQVGQIAPDFELPDSSGIQRRLSELAAGGPLVLLFYRGYW